ncbi:MAG: beta-lactamase family protein [Deltaproteobacteria bacterium]|nr:beta-lactamase family protein [Deltaproteobacteria bacterium]
MLGLGRRLRRSLRHVRVYPAEEVTRRSEAECDPRAAGLAQDDVDAIWRSVVRFYRQGLHPAIGICVRRGGRVVLDRTIGHLRGNAPDDPRDGPKEIATPGTLFNLFSAAKSVTSMLVHLLDERNLLRLDDAVADFIPEFGRHGKHWITIRHILTHRAGIPVVPDAKVNLDLLADTGRILALLCDARPVSPPGRRLAYHAITGGFILGEIVRRVTGRDVQTFLKEEVLDPCGFRDLRYGARLEDFSRIAVNAFTGLTPPFPASWLLRRALGADIRDVVAMSNDPRFLTALIPSGNVQCTANDACRFFQLLLNGGAIDGARAFAPATVRRAVAEQTYFAFDFTMWLPIGYGMGFMLGHEWASLYGPRAPHAFGHIGFTNVLVWADPDRDLAVALLNSGKPMINPELIWWYDLTRVIASRCAATPGSGRRPGG